MFLDQKSIKFFEISFFFKEYQTIITTFIDPSYFTQSEKLYFAKIGPNFVGSAVIRENYYKKTKSYH